MKLSLAMLVLMVVTLILIAIFSHPLLHQLYLFEKAPIKETFEQLGSFSVMGVSLPLIIVGCVLTSYLNGRAKKVIYLPGDKSLLRSKFFGIELTRNGKIWLTVFSVVLTLILSLSSTVAAIFVQRYSSIKKGIIIRPEDERFTTILPNKVFGIIREPQVLKLAQGDLNGLIYMSKSGGNASWLIGSYKFSEQFINLTSRENFNNVAQQLIGSYTNAINGQIEQESLKDFQGNPGLTCLINGKDEDQTPIYMRVDLVSTKSHLYQIIYTASNKEELQSKDIQRYFNSFQAK